MQVGREGNRQRFLDAVHHRFTGEVPAWEPDVAEEVVDAIMGRPMGSKSLNLPAPDYVEFLKRVGFDVGYLFEGWFLGRKNKYDEKGRPQYIDGTIKSRKDFEQIKPPSLDIIRRRIEGFLDAVEGTHIGCIVALDVATTIANTAIGPVDFLMKMLDDSDFVDEFIERVEAYTLPLAECAASYPLDAILVTGPMGQKSGLMISRELHERFIFPTVEKAVNIIKAKDIPTILHSDGSNADIMDWILDTGFDVLNPIEPGAANFDIYDLKETCGDRICLSGNIDVSGVLSFGTPDEVRADTLEHLRRLSPGGGYVCSSSHDISQHVPVENFIAMNETIRSFNAKTDT